MFLVVLKEVPFHTDVFGLLAYQGVLGVCVCALVVLPNGGCSSDGFAEDLLHKVAEVEFLLGGVCRKAVLASKVDWVTRVCCLILHVTGPRLSVNKYLERDLRVLLSVAQSAFAKCVTWRLWSAPLPPNARRRSMVP
jgi:hypothetical protein